MKPEQQPRSFSQRMREPWTSLLQAHPKLVPLLWFIIPILIFALGLTDLWVHHHSHFGFDGTFGFYSWFGFGVCVAMVLVAKFVIAAALTRKDSYYDD